MILSQSYSDGSFAFLGQLIDRPPEELLKQLRWLTTPYESFFISKGSGGARREIEAPTPVLKGIQRRLLDQLLYRAPVGPDVHGFVPGRSILSQARAHRGQQQLIGFDLADAFPSISRERVLLALHRRLGSHLKHRAPRVGRELRDETLELIADLCTWRGRLPQGAPTSGAMLNLALAPLDRKVRRAMRRWKRGGFDGLVYTRYADDLSLSAADQLPSDAASVLRSAIHHAGLRFNDRKTERADRRRGQAFVVCGLHVDGEEIRLPRKTLRRYRAALHAAFYEDPLSPETRAKIAGIAGLVTMIYGGWPRALDQGWRLYSTRHGLADSPRARPPQSSGYGAS